MDIKSEMEALLKYNMDKIDEIHKFLIKDKKMKARIENLKEVMEFMIKRHSKYFDPK